MFAYIESLDFTSIFLLNLNKYKLNWILLHDNTMFHCTKIRHWTKKFKIVWLSKLIFKLYRRNEDRDCIPTNLKEGRVYRKEADTINSYLPPSSWFCLIVWCCSAFLKVVWQKQFSWFYKRINILWLKMCKAGLFRLRIAVVRVNVYGKHFVKTRDYILECMVNQAKFVHDLNPVNQSLFYYQTPNSIGTNKS